MQLSMQPNTMKSRPLSTVRLERRLGSKIISFGPYL